MTQAIRKEAVLWPKSGEKPQATKVALLPECPKCGSTGGQWRGYRTTRKAITHRRWCKICGKWFSDNQRAPTPSAKESAGRKRLQKDERRFDAWMEAYQQAIDRGEAQ